MARLADVNTGDIRGAIELGCRTMSRVFDADDNDVPFFDVEVRPDVRMRFSPVHSESHVPGRHLNALLSAEDAAGVHVDEEAVEKHTRATFLSFAGALPLPLNRAEQTGPPVVFRAHNIREGLHALYALARYRRSERAREVAEACIVAILRYWTPERGWDYDRLEREHGLTLWRRGTLVSGVARAMGPLVKYFRATGHGPALELAVALKDAVLEEAFPTDGSYDVRRLGSHTHSTTCVMSSLAQLADLTRDSVLLDRVKAFYDNGLWRIRDALGWVIESDDPSAVPDRGEVNNTGDILETALILGRWGHRECYQDAERILRGHLLPSQLTETSFIGAPPNPEGIDGRREVAARLKGAFGFPAPYGHAPLGAPGVKFNLDIVGGAVGSLCEAYREVARTEETGLRVNLLFDHDTPDVRVESPYSRSGVRITPKRPGPLYIRVPRWVDLDAVGVEGVAGPLHTHDGYLLVAEPQPGEPITVTFPLPTEQMTMEHRTRRIRVRTRGDEVVTMDDFGADLTFFDPIE